jgi:transcriptional regulator with XRE-family HTH domain
MRTQIHRLGVEHHDIRVSAGLSLRAAAEASGSSKSQLWRFERAAIDRLSLTDLAAWFAVLGHDVGIKTFPAGDPIRDKAQVALLERFRRLLHPSLDWRTEVALPIAGDLRAWDAEVRGHSPRPWRARVEAETRIADGQALERKLALKLRDDPAGHLVLLVADTRANRAAIAALRAGLTQLFPCGARAALGALRDGHEPPGNAIVLM